jgi:hypothetical protein
MTVSEQAMLVATAGAASQLTTRLADAIATFIGTLNAAGWTTNSDGTVPDQLRNCVMSYAVWEWLKDFPQLTKFQTKEREKAYEDAVSDLSKIANRTYGAIESPFGTDNTTGNWNSRPKIILRTDPIPSPQFQFANNNNVNPLYANPNAPTDAVESNSPDDPNIPLNVTIQALNGVITLTWLPVEQEGITYNVYKGTAQGQELATPLATGLTIANFSDAAVVIGTRYFYFVRSAIGALLSDKSTEVTIIAA